MAKQSSKSKPTHFYSSISVAIVMFLLGMFVLILLHSHNLTNLIKEKMNIVAELSEKADSKKALEQISTIDEIRPQSITLIPKEKAIKTMGSNLKIKFDPENNPFRDVITFNVKAEYYSIETLKGIKARLEQFPDIDTVYYEDLTIKNIKSNLNKAAYTIFFIGLIFVFLAIVIIQNTINLSMYADRWEIKTMELIGAKWSFIKMPYIKTGVIVGFRAFLLATLLIAGILSVLYVNFPRIWEVISLGYVFLALVTIFLLSITIPAITTNAASNKYLQKNMSSMYD